MKTSRARGGWRATARTTRVLGIDPGTRVAGYAVIDFNARGDASILDAGVCRLDDKADLAVRLRQLFDDVNAILDEHAPTHLALEAIFSHPEHARTAIQMAHGRGVVLLAAEMRGIPVAELPPAEVKRALTGNGRASKAQMQQAVRSQCGLATLPEPSDVADAIGIALTAARRLQGALA